MDTLRSVALDEKIAFGESAYESKITVTAKEELALEVLAARFRLGENIWTFHSKHGRTLSDLEEKGLVYTMHGVVQGTIRAGLTDEGKAAMLSDTYTAPKDTKGRI